MLRSIVIQDGDENHTLRIELPNTCGICHIDFVPDFLVGFFGNYGHQSLTIEAVFQCLICRSLMIAYYNRRNNRVPFKLQKVVPYKHKEIIIDPEITKLSPSFVELYKQLFKAEYEGLNLLLGVGYRIALEHLVKDYLVYLEPKNKEIINSRSLYRNISKIDNQNIRELSRKVSWINADEIQLTKKWDKKDIDDLKKLVKLISSFVTMDIKLKKQLDNLN